MATPNLTGKKVNVLVYSGTLPPSPPSLPFSPLRPTNNNSRQRNHR